MGRCESRSRSRGEEGAEGSGRGGRGVVWLGSREGAPRATQKGAEWDGGKAGRGDDTRRGWDERLETLGRDVHRAVGATVWEAWEQKPKGHLGF